MKIVRANGGASILIDAEDYELVSTYKWNLKKDKWGLAYATAYQKETKKYILMHRLIMNAPKGKVVDHINRNTTDNRKSNLRLCSVAENSRNRRLQSNNTLGYKGVYKTSDCSKWSARINLKGVRKHLGTFSTIKEAALAYDLAARKYYKDFAVLNFG